MVPPEVAGAAEGGGVLAATGGGSTGAVRLGDGGAAGRDAAARLEVAGACEMVCMRRDTAGALGAGATGAKGSGVITPSDSVTGAPGLAAAAGSPDALDAPDALDGDAPLAPID